MLYRLWGVIFGEIARDYGRGFKVKTFVGEAAIRMLWPTGNIPAACNDNEGCAA